MKLTDVEQKELDALRGKEKDKLSEAEQRRLSELEAKNKQQDDIDGRTYSEDYVKALRNEAAKYRTKAKELESEFAKFAEVDVDDYKRLKQKEAELEQKRLMEKGEFETLRKQLTDAHAKELQKIDAEKIELQNQIKTLSEELDTTLLRHEISNAAVIAKAINPALVEMVAIRSMKVEKAEDGRRVIRVLDGRGEARVDIKTGEPVKVATLLEEMKQSTEFAHLFTGGKSGAGSGTLQFGGQAIQNPWKKDTLNLTLQGKIMRENPDMAKRLKGEAGVS